MLGLTAPPTASAEPFPSTCTPLPSGPVLIENATILTGTGERINNGSVLPNETGVTVAFSGAEIHQSRKQGQAASNAVANGLPREAALAALTVSPADPAARSLSAGKSRVTQC